MCVSKKPSRSKSLFLISRGNGKCPVDQQQIKSDDILKPSSDLLSQMGKVLIQCQLCLNRFSLLEIEKHVKEAHVRLSRNNSKEKDVKVSQTPSPKKFEINPNLERTINETLGVDRQSLTLSSIIRDDKYQDLRLQDILNDQTP